MKPIPGTDLSVQNVFCIGRNFAEHARELGDELPSEPIVFLKPTSAIAYSGDLIELPKQSARVDHELEVVVAIGRSAKNISAADAHLFIAALGIGLDLTARDLQGKAKQKSLPWMLSKGFDGFAPISSFVAPPKDSGQLGHLKFDLRVNGDLRQSGNTAEMITPIPQLIEYLSWNFTLNPGDLIFTGTPKGVAPIRPGDRLVARLEDWTELTVQVRN